MLNFRSGLGLNPAVTAAANTTLIRDESGNAGGTVYSDEHGGGIGISQHTWASLWAPSLDPQAQAVWNQALQSVSAQSGVGTCPTAGYQSWETGIGRPNLIYGGDVTAPIEFAMPGTFSYLGVVFGVNEVANGTYEKTLVPNTWQRQQAELEAIRQSWKNLIGHIAYGHARYAFGGDIATAMYRAALSSKFSKYNPSNWGNLSVDEVVAAQPDVMLYALNFERNPLQPTPTERTGKGGWVSWISRGGYPLSRKVVTGQARIFDGDGFINTCSGGKCLYINPYGYPIISCASMLVGKKGVVASSPNDDGGWRAFVAFPQDTIHQSQVQFTIKYKDPSKWQTIGKAGEWAMKQIAQIACANQGVTKTQLEAAMAEKCLDTTGKKCTKGTPGCTCTKPTSGQEASVGIFNGSMSLWCAGWMAENLPVPPPVLPPLVNTPPIDEPDMPWWAIGTAGLLLGAAASAFLGPDSKK